MVGVRLGGPSSGDRCRAAPRRGFLDDSAPTERSNRRRSCRRKVVPHVRKYTLHNNVSVSFVERCRCERWKEERPWVRADHCLPISVDAFPSHRFGYYYHCCINMYTAIVVGLWGCSPSPGGVAPGGGGRRCARGGFLRSDDILGRLHFVLFLADATSNIKFPAWNFTGVAASFVT